MSATITICITSTRNCFNELGNFGDFFFESITKKKNNLHDLSSFELSIVSDWVFFFMLVVSLT